MLLTLREKILGGIAIVLLLFLTGAAILYAHERNQRLAVALQKDSLKAELDTTKRLFDRRVQNAVGDSMTVIQRRIIQTNNPQLDELAKQLKSLYGQIQVMKSDIRVAIKTQSGTVASTVNTDTSAVFHQYKQPFTLDANVIAQRKPKPWSLNWTISTDTAHVDARMTCGPAENGIHRADLTLTGPNWLPVGIGQVVQDPALCNSAATERLFVQKWPWWKPHYSAFVGLGYDPLDQKPHLVIGGGLAWNFK